MGPTRKADLTLELSIAISMLPRHVRHDLWRVCEPQHGRAVEAVVQAVKAVLDYNFIVEPKERFVEWSSTR